MVFVCNRARLEYEGLYPVLSLALVLFTYGATATVGGNGFLAVYIAGLIMGNTPVIHQRSLMRFHDGVAWLMQIAMFLVLGLLVFPSRLPQVATTGLLVSAFSIIVARPISVFLSMAASRMTIREKAMISWVGLRGAVPVILATFPLLAGVEEAETIFHLVFFIVLTSVLVTGTTIPLVARWLKVDMPSRTRRRAPLELDRVEGVEGELVEFEIEDHAPAVGKRIVDLNLPKGALFVLIEKQGRYFVPSGGTVLEAGDTVSLLASSESLPHVERALSIQQEV
jgi:cell volume regulation protein A